MKTHSNELKELIDCMNSSEKKEFFDKNNQNDSIPDYLILFKALENMKNEDESDIQKQLNLKHYKRIKYYLHFALLQYLSTLEKNNIEKEVMTLISVSNMLMERSLFLQAKNILIRAKNKAIDYELFPFQLIIDEKLFHVNGHLNNRIFVDAFLEVKNHERFNTIINKIKTEELYKHAILKRWQYYEKNGAILRNKKQTSEFLNLLKPYVTSINENELSTKSKHDYYSLKASYLREKNNIKEAVRYLEISAQLSESKKLEIIGMLPQLMVSLNNLLFIYSKYDMLDKLRSTLDKISANLPSKASNKKVGLVSLLVYESYYCKYVPDYIHRKKKLLWIEKEYPTILGKERTLRTIQTVLNLSVAYFCDFNFKKALALINTLEMREDFLNFPAIASIIKVYKLILYFEMEKYDLLAFSIRNTYRYLLKNQIYEQFEKAVIKGLTKLLTSNTQRSQREVLITIYNDLIQVKRNEHENSIFQTFNFSGWIKCKLERKKYSYLMTVD